MTVWRAELETAMEAALQPGDLLAPSDLLNLCRGLDNPIATLMGRDSWQEIFTALDSHLGFVSLLRNSHAPKKQDHQQKIPGAIRWLIATIRDWRKANDPNNALIVAVVVVASRLDEDGALWALLPDNAGGNHEFGRELAQLLASFRINLELAVTKTPISEGEEFEGFVKADADRNWPGLRRLAEGVAFQAMTNVLVSQSMRALGRFFPDLLIQVAQAVPQIGIAMQMVTSVSVEAGFNLAARSDNDFLQFASVCRLFNIYARVGVLSTAEEDALDGVLQSVAKDPVRWASWMRAFVAHPYQTRQMHPAIGRALAGADDIALQAYLDALLLQPSWLGREEVAFCLEAFASRVPLQRRQSAWRMAFARWSEWDFGARDGLSRLTSISYSNIDFAIVGYTTECLTPEQREAHIERCLGDLTQTEGRWHKSQRDFMEYTFRVMSRFQPFGHARVVGTDRGQWLRDKKSDYLLDRFDQPFWVQRYHIQKAPA